jgi:hypothetical protein
MLSLCLSKDKYAVLYFLRQSLSLQSSSWSASRTLIRFFIISKLEKKIMFTTHERSTDTPKPTSVRSQFSCMHRDVNDCRNAYLYMNRNGRT